MFTLNASMRVCVCLISILSLYSYTALKVDIDWRASETVMSVGVGTVVVYLYNIRYVGVHSCTV